jgi:hypothetical protein
MKLIRRALLFLSAAILAASAIAQPAVTPDLPVLKLEGYAPPASIRPSPPPLALSNLWVGQTTEVAPQSGFPGTSTVSLSNGLARFHYAGPDGVLEYQWRAPQSANESLFGDITLHAQMTGDMPVTVPLANSAALSWSQAASPVASGWVQTNQGCTLWRPFQVGPGTATVRITGQMVGKSLVLDLACDQSNGRACFSGQLQLGRAGSAGQKLRLFRSFLRQWSHLRATGSRGFTARFAVAGWPGHPRRPVEFHSAWQPSRRQL